MTSRVYVPANDETYEPTDDPDFWQAVNVCGPDCHAPIHAFKHPERIRHFEKASVIRDEGRPVKPARRPRRPKLLKAGDWAARRGGTLMLHYVSDGRAICGARLGDKPLTDFGLHICTKCKHIFDISMAAAA